MKLIVYVAMFVWAILQDHQIFGQKGGKKQAFKQIMGKILLIDIQGCLKRPLLWTHNCIVWPLDVNV